MLPQLLVLGLICQTSTPLSTVEDLVVNEFCAINDTTLLDGDGQASDWIELHNVSGTAVNLAGWGLTDDAAQPFKWVFPARVLPPRSYLIVFASDKNRLGTELHTNFKLDGGGEYLALTRPDGRRAHGYAPAYPAQLTDISYGLAVAFTTGRTSTPQQNEGYFARPTPGARNSRMGLPVEPVQASVPRGFQDAPFSLLLSCTTPGVTIWYTLDGSVPTPSGGTRYVAPIPISSNTVVRTVALLPVGNPLTEPVAYTYLFAQQVMQQSQSGALAAGFPAAWVEQDGTNWTMGGTRPGAWYGLDTSVTALYTTQQLVDSLKAIPSVSLAMPAEDWFAYDPGNARFGLYPNSEGDGPAWEREGSMEFIDPNGGPETQVNCVLKTQGGSSTNDGNRSQLSLALKFRSDVGPPEFEFPLFPGSPVERFDYLLLDGGNQGSIHAAVTISQKRHAQGMRDQFMMNMQRAMGRHSPYGRHVHVYLNGLYWGVYNLHERPDQDWAGAHFDGDANQYDWIKTGGVRFGNNNPITHPAPGVWNIIKDIELNGLDEPDVYGGKPAYEALQDYVDLDDYIDYLILNFWAINLDWPQRNWMATGRARRSADFYDFNPEVQFRFHSWDAELSLGWEGLTTVGDAFYDRTQLRTNYDGSAIWLYSELMNHAEFRVRFGDRAQVHLGPGGALFVDPAYSAMGTPFDPAFPERNAPATTYWQLAAPLQQAFWMEYARWGNYFHAPGSVTPADWVNERRRILDEFCAVRSSVLKAQLRNSGIYPLQDPPAFAQHGGPVPIGFDLVVGVPPGTTVYYTTDGSDPRLPGGAIAPGAHGYFAPIELAQLTTVKARALGGIGWSALVAATFPIDYDIEINEVMADNDTFFYDEFGEFEDWIELFNAGNASVDLSGMYLSDDLDDSQRWQIPAGTSLAAGASILFWADGQELQGPLHTSFSLASTGEEVGLFHSEASGNFALDTLVFGPMAQDVSLACLPDGAPRRYTLAQPSPAARNVPPLGAWRAYDARDPAANVAELALTSSVIAIGQILEFTVDVAQASTSGALLVGTGTLESPFGAGFRLTTTDLGLLPFTTDGLGHALVNLSVPASPSFVGLTIYAQSLVGSTLSNAATFTLGP